jgi:hypothetical protein
MTLKGILPISKEALVTLNLGQHALKTLVFIAGITDEFIMGLNVLHITMHPWIWDTMCCEWAMKQCDNVHSTI